MSELAMELEQEATMLRSVAPRGSDARPAGTLRAARSPKTLRRRAGPPKGDARAYASEQALHAYERLQCWC
eukprot:5985157-Alexandrium_andersonii.AAC.1